MRIIEDVIAEKNLIDQCINSNGGMAEHNYRYLLYSAESSRKPVFMHFGGDKGQLALAGKTWKFITEPISPEAERAGLLAEAVEAAFSSGATKVMMVLREETREKLISMLPEKYIARKPSYIYHWPVYNLHTFDPLLSGAEWKKFRNIKNSFISNHEMQFTDIDSMKKEDMFAIFEKWKERRNAADRIEKDRYINAIENGFKGLDVRKAMIIDGVPCAISAGWRIPNSNSFYMAFGITNYAHKNIGEFLSIMELTMLKDLGYDYMDFGGSDAALLQFKMKFRPEYVYKTIEFYVVMG